MINESYRNADPDRLIFSGYRLNTEQGDVGATKQFLEEVGDGWLFLIQKSHERAGGDTEARAPISWCEEYLATASSKIVPRQLNRSRFPTVDDLHGPLPVAVLPSVNTLSGPVSNDMMNENYQLLFMAVSSSYKRSGAGVMLHNEIESFVRRIENLSIQPQKQEGLALNTHKEETKAGVFIVAYVTRDVGNEAWYLKRGYRTVFEEQKGVGYWTAVRGITVCTMVKEII